MAGDRSIRTWWIEIHELRGDLFVEVSPLSLQVCATNRHPILQSYPLRPRS